MPLDHLTMSPEIRSEIEALVTEHAWMLDHHKSDQLADLNTENGRILGFGADKLGRNAIAAYGRDHARMRLRQARHVTTNLRRRPKGPKDLTGTCVITLFRSCGVGLGTADPIALADAEDVYVQCDDGRW